MNTPEQLVLVMLTEVLAQVLSTVVDDLLISFSFILHVTSAAARTTSVISGNSNGFKSVSG